MGLTSLLTYVATACMRRKPLSTSSDTSTNLNRCLSTLDLTFIGVGSTLGSGIYVLTGEVAKDKAGPAVVLSFILAAIASILSGLCYAEFGARFPKAGSAYAYCYVSIGEFCAFFIGWNVLMEYLIGASAIAKGLTSYVDSLTGGVIQNTTINILGEINAHGFSNYFDVFSILIIVVMTIVLAMGIKDSSRFNNLIVALNIIVICIVIIAGFTYADVDNWSNFAPYGFRGVVQGASTCFFAFIGFDVIATTCEEAKNPGKSMPLSILGTIVICCLAYLGVSSAITLMVPYTQLDKTAAVSVAFSQRGSTFMTQIVGGGATVALVGCTFVTLIAPPRLLYAMSNDGLLPAFFSRVHEKTSTPLISTIISGAMVALMAAILDLESLVEMLSIGTLLAYSIVDVSVLVLRYRPTDRLPVTSSIDKGVDHKPCWFLSQSSNERISRVLRGPSTCNIVIISIILELLGFCIIMDKCSESLFYDKDPIYIAAWILLLLLIVCGGIFLHTLDSYTEGLSFVVPFVPWIPIIGLGFNIALMIELSNLTWIRLAVWMAVGLVVYFCYSIRHSTEADKYTVMIDSSCVDDEHNTCENVPLLMKDVKKD